MKLRRHVVVCLVDYFNAGAFFIKLARSDGSRKYVFVTHLLSIYLKCREESIKCHLISKYTRVPDDVFDVCDLHRTREIVGGVLSLEEASNMASAYMSKINMISQSALSTKLLIWNGQSILGKVATALRKKGHVKTLFFEIANVPGKIFVDPEGVNYESQLRRSLECRNDSSSFRSVCGFDEWKEDYVKYKENTNVVPQAVGKRLLHINHIQDYLYSKVFGYRFYSDRSFKNKLPQFLPNNLKEKYQCLKIHDELDLKALMPFNFFPGQVHDDTQLLFNSDIGNVEAVSKILESTSETLIVKPHPAGDEREFEFLSDYIISGRLILTSMNTLQLIKGSRSVYTINSTVGFESLILGKETFFLGSSIYSLMSADVLEWYVVKYLIDVDFFSNDLRIDFASIEEIFSRAD